MKLITIMGICGATLLIIAGLVFIKPITSIATFDTQRVKGKFIHQLALHNASHELVNASSGAFNRNLHKVLNDYAREKRVIIIEAQQVLASSRDVTEEIVPRLARAMRGQP